LNLKRIAITGPESTGKSWLAEQLAAHFHTLWVPEYSREYLQKLGRTYGFPDIVSIARGQLEREEKAAQRVNRYLFCDTDPLVTKVWSEFKYGKCDPWIAEKVTTHRYHLYLLCNIDLPWQDDPLREHPENRKELFNLYHNTLAAMNADFAIISGYAEDRLKNAINAVSNRFTKTT
jgi:NadR type nicotinamide-nucleotide adenylyltransferase